MKSQMIKVEKLIPSKANPRFTQLVGENEQGELLTTDQDGIPDLAESIKAVGVLQPLRVSKAKDGYTIIAGHRRHAAAIYAGLKEVPCLIVDGKEKNIELKHLVENLQRVDLTPAETGRGVYEALKAKISQMKLARSVGRSEAWVSKFKTIGQALATEEKNEGDWSDSAKLMMRSTNGDEAYEIALEILGKKSKGSKKEKKKAGKQNDLIGMSLTEILIARAAELGITLVDSSAKTEKDGTGAVMNVSILFSNEKDAKAYFGF